MAQGVSYAIAQFTRHPSKIDRDPERMQLNFDFFQFGQRFLQALGLFGNLTVGFNKRRR